MKRFIYTVQELPRKEKRVCLYQIKSNDVHPIGCKVIAYQDAGATAVALAVDNKLVKPKGRLDMGDGKYLKTPVSWENEGVAKFTQV